MRTIITAFASLLLLAFMANTGHARERRNGFAMTGGVFGVFSQRRKVARLRARRAKLRRRNRLAAARRAKLRRSATRRVRRSAGRRIALARSKQRRSRVSRRARVNRGTASRRKVARRRSSAKAASGTRRFARQTVPYRSKQKPGTIVVDTKTRHLYYVLSRSKAIRYGVAVGKEGFAWSGVSRVRRKVKWPTWTPPSEMIERKPELAEFRAGMPGGPDNPLGARALYLFQGKMDTLYRIHGTNNPGSIGRAASSGCIRMRNEDVAHLYARVGMGAKVIVR